MAISDTFHNREESIPHTKSSTLRVGPPWLPEFLRQSYFSPCPLHVPSASERGFSSSAQHHPKSERNFFCISCSTPFKGIALCPSCLESHRGHSLLQIRRSSYHDVIRITDISKHVDVSQIQIYVINSSKVVFLNGRPQARPQKGAPYHCLTCNRTLIDPSRYCSINCKLRKALEGSEKGVCMGLVTNQEDSSAYFENSQRVGRPDREIFTGPSEKVPALKSVSESVFSEPESEVDTDDEDKSLEKKILRQWAEQQCRKMQKRGESGIHVPPLLACGKGVDDSGGDSDSCTSEEFAKEKRRRTPKVHENFKGRTGECPIVCSWPAPDTFVPNASPKALSSAAPAPPISPSSVFSVHEKRKAKEENVVAFEHDSKVVPLKKRKLAALISEANTISAGQDGQIEWKEGHSDDLATHCEGEEGVKGGVGKYSEEAKEQVRSENLVTHEEGEDVKEGVDKESEEAGEQLKVTSVKSQERGSERGLESAGSGGRLHCLSSWEGGLLDKESVKRLLLRIPDMEAASSPLSPHVSATHLGGEIWRGGASHSAGGEKERERTSSLGFNILQDFSESCRSVAHRRKGVPHRAPEA